MAAVIAATSVCLSPLIARAQPAAKLARVGYLGSSSPSVEPHYLEALRKELRDLGYVEGKTIAIIPRWAEGRDERLPGLVAELIRLDPDVIVTTGTPGAFAAKQATKTIPIVMASAGDPVRTGLVASLAQPGGNVTGNTVLGPELEGKRLQLLKQAVPALSPVAVLWNSANPAIKFYLEQAQAAARTLNVTLQPVVEVRGEADLERAFSRIAAAQPHALMVLADRLLLAHRARIVAFAASRRLPAMYPYREFVDAGGLMSYSPSSIELFRSAARYVDKILRGARAGDLPVQEPSKFELVINQKTARTLQLAIPSSMLVSAELIQ